MVLLEKLYLHDYPVKEKSFESNGFKIYHIGISSRGSDDKVYQKNRNLQKKVPRAFFTITKNDKIITTSHGTHKFTGMEDNNQDSIIFTPQYDNFDKSSKVIFTEKSNGKMVTFKIFNYDGIEYCFLSSKTSGIIFPIQDLYENKIHAEELLRNIFIAFKELWISLEKKSQIWFKDMCKSGHTFQLEYNDGKHIISLPKNENSKLQFTVMLKTYIDPSKSHVISYINDMMFYDYLDELKIPNKYLVKKKEVSWKEYNKINNEVMYTNIFSPGDTIEGYVAYICTDDNDIIAIVKIKNISYIILRMMREHLKKNATCISIKNHLKRRLTGPKAYPILKYPEYRYNLEFIFCHFLSYLTKVSIEKKIEIKHLLDFSINSIGMANLWKMFTEKYLITLDDCYISNEEFIKKISKCQFPKLITKRSIKKGCIYVANGRNIPNIIDLIKNNDYSIRVTKSKINKNTYSICGEEGEWNESNIIEILNKMSIEEINLSQLHKKDDTWKNELSKFFTKDIFKDDNKYLKEDIFIIANRKITIKKYDGTNPNNVWILQGPQGVGKSTIAELSNRNIVCADDYPNLYSDKFNSNLIQKAHKYSKALFAKYFYKNKKNNNIDIIVSNTSSELWEISPYAMACYETGFYIIRIEPVDDGSSLKSLHLGDNQERAKKIIKQKLKTIRSYKLPNDICDIIYANPLKNLGIKITVVGLPLDPFIKYFEEKDPIENTKSEFHVTLKYGKDERYNFPKKIICHATKLLIKEDNDSILKCMEVILYDNKKNIIKVEEKQLHITIKSSGIYKPVDSNKLISREFIPDKIEDVNIFINGVVKLLF